MANFIIGNLCSGRALKATGASACKSRLHAERKIYVRGVDDAIRQKHNKDLHEEQRRRQEGG